MSRGIFSLNESYNEQVSGDWSTASDVWVIGSPVLVRESPFGYIAGGDTGSGDKLSTVERIDFGNDNSKPSFLTSSLNKVLRGSIKARFIFLGKPPTLW